MVHRGGSAIAHSRWSLLEPCLCAWQVQVWDGFLPLLGTCLFLPPYVKAISVHARIFRLLWPEPVFGNGQSDVKGELCEGQLRR